MILIIISPPDFYENEHDIIQQLFKMGLEHLHLRKPGWSYGELENYLRRIKSGYYNRIIIHSHHALAEKYSLKGIHFPEKVRTELRNENKQHHPASLLNKEGIKVGCLGNQNFNSQEIYKQGDTGFTGLQLSTSFHDLSELYRYDSRYHYVFISPVFNSISKEEYKAAFKEDDIARVLRQTNYNVIALGGITIDRLTKIKQLGFSGIAVLGAIWNSPDPVVEFVKLKQEVWK